MIYKFFRKIKSSLLFTISTFIVQGINALTLPIFTRLLSQSDYGILSASNSIQNFSTAIFRMGTHQAILKQFIEFTERDRKDYFFSVLIFSFLWSLLVMGLFYLINSIFSFELFNAVDFYPYLFIPLLTSGFGVAYALFQSQLRVMNLSKKFLIYTLSYVISAVFLSIILIRYCGLGVVGKLLGNLIPYMILFVIIIFANIGKLKIKYWVDAIKFGSPLTISSLMSSIVMIYTIGYLSRAVSLDNLGVFQVGRNLGLFIPQFLFQSITLTYVPFLYKNIRQNTVGNITKYNTVLIIAFCGGLTLSVLMAKYIILIFTTKAYLSALVLVKLFFVNYIFKIIYFFPKIFLFSKNKTMMVSNIEIVSSLIYLGMIHVLVPKYSIEGIAIAIGIQELLKMILIVSISDLKIGDVFNLIKLRDAVRLLRG